MKTLLIQIKHLLIWCLLESGRNRTHGKRVHTQWIGAAIAAVAAIVGSVISAKANKKANQQNLDYNANAYNRERADALTDYKTQTEYNNPSSQMARLREAGLNPILAAGNISSSSPTVRSSDYNSYDAQPVDIGPGIASLGENAGNSIGQYLDYQLKTAQLDNLKRTNTVITQDALLRQAQTESTLSTIPRNNAATENTVQSTEGAAFDLSQRQRLSDISAQAAEANLTKLKSETQVLLNRDEREAAANSSSLREAAARIMTMSYNNAKSQDERQEIKARIRNLDTDNQLKQLDLNLKKAGVQPGSSTFNRMLQMFLEQQGITKNGSIIDGAVNFSRKVDSTFKANWKKNPWKRK